MARHSSCFSVDCETARRGQVLGQTDLLSATLAAIRAHYAHSTQFQGEIYRQKIKKYSHLYETHFWASIHGYKEVIAEFAALPSMHESIRDAQWAISVFRSHESMYLLGMASCFLVCF